MSFTSILIMLGTKQIMIFCLVCLQEFLFFNLRNPVTVSRYIPIRSNFSHIPQKMVHSFIMKIQFFFYFRKEFMKCIYRFVIFFFFFSEVLNICIFFSLSLLLLFFFFPILFNSFKHVTSSSLAYTTSIPLR